MQYENRIKDFIGRSSENLKYIEKAKNDGENVYETTQLISNFIAILILYNENAWMYDGPIHEKNLSCKIIGENTYNDNFEEHTYLFINHLRNACCHDGVEVNKETEEIQFITFYDTKTEKGEKKEVRIMLSVEEMRNIYNYLVKNRNKMKLKNKRK